MKWSSNRKWSWLLYAAAIATGVYAGYVAWFAGDRLDLGAGFASANGRIEGVENDIAAKTAGRVTTLLVDEGELVKAGDVLARTDTAVLEAEAQGLGGRQAGRVVRDVRISLMTDVSLWRRALYCAAWSWASAWEMRGSPWLQTVPRKDPMLLLLLCHWIGDFLLQSGWMALNKSRDWRALAVHVGAYCVPFLGLGLLGYDVRVFVLVNALLHLLTDAMTSQATGWLGSRKSPWFFTAIGLDQFIHAACLWYTMPLLA